MDFAFGPSEGQGVPAFPDNEGLQWELVRGSSTLLSRLPDHDADRVSPGHAHIPSPERWPL
jgi:hypothetical protein